MEERIALDPKVSNEVFQLILDSRIRGYPTLGPSIDIARLEEKMHQRYLKLRKKF